MISVCMAAYNGETYIKEQLSSILNQLTNEDEVIISDDGSTDSTINIIKSFNDERVKILHNKQTKEGKSKHQIVTANFENALKNAKGDYIFLADQDDVWKEDKVKISLSYLEKADMVCSNYDVIDNKNSIIKHSFYKDNPISTLFIKNIIKMPFHGCCMAFKKDVLNFALPFSVNLPLHDNWIGILCSINKNYKISYIEEPLVLYRQHSDNVSGISTNSFFYKVFYRLIFSMQVFKRFLKHK